MMELATRANRSVGDTAPWALAKAGRDAELDTALANLVRTVARLAVLARPFLPVKAEAAWALLGTGRPLDAGRLPDLETRPAEGLRVRKPPHLSPSAPVPVCGLAET